MSLVVRPPGTREASNKSISVAGCPLLYFSFLIGCSPTFVVMLPPVLRARGDQDRSAHAYLFITGLRAGIMGDFETHGNGALCLSVFSDVRRARIGPASVLLEPVLDPVIV